MKTRVFYRDDHSTNEVLCLCGDKDKPDEVLFALRNYLQVAMETAEGDFACDIVFQDMTDEEVAALPDV